MKLEEQSSGISEKSFGQTETDKKISNDYKFSDKSIALFFCMPFNLI